MTEIRVCREGRTVAGSGFGGPALYPGLPVNEWRGRLRAVGGRGSSF